MTLRQIERMLRLHSTRRSEHVLIAVALLATFYIAVCFANAIACRPPLDGDSAFFSIPAVEYQRTSLVWYPYWTMIPDYNSNVFPHGNLYPIVLAVLAPLADFPGIYLANFILFLTYTLLFIAFCYSTPSVNPFVAAGSLLLALVVIVPSSFRPEVLAAIVILFWILCLRCAADRHQALTGVISMTALSILSATQPTFAILSAAFLTYWTIYRDGTKAISSLALIGLGSAVGAAAVNQIVTGRLLEWIGSLVERIYSRTEVYHILDNIFDEYVLSTEHFLLFFGLLTAVALFGLLHAAKLRQQGTWTDKHLLSAAGLVCLLLLYFVGRGLPPVVYNVASFIPMAIVLLWNQAEFVRSSIAKWCLTIAFAIAVFGAIASLARNTVVTAFDLARSDVVSYSEFVAAIRNLLATHRGVAVDEALLSALPAEHASLVGVFTTVPGSDGPIMWDSNKGVPAAVCMLVIKQSNTGYERPPDIAGFTLVEDHFAPVQRVLGLIIYRTPKSYNYAVYRWTGDTCH